MAALRITIERVLASDKPSDTTEWTEAALKMLRDTNRTCTITYCVDLKEFVEFLEENVSYPLGKY